MKLRFATVGILFLLCCGCGKEESKELRGEELCRLIRKASKNRIDSLVALSAGLSDAERYVVLYCGLHRLDGNYVDGQRDRYVGQLRALGQPKVRDKVTALMLLKHYDWFSNIFDYSDRERYYSRDIVPWAYDAEWISALLFDLEHRWQLTPPERLRFFMGKAKLYRIVFGEFRPAQMIMEEGFRFARTYRIDPELMWEYYTEWNHLFVNYLEEEKGPKIVMNEMFAELADTLGFDAGRKRIIYTILGGLYSEQGKFADAYKWMSRAGLSSLSHSRVVPVYLGLDSLSEALAFVEKARRNVKPVPGQAKVHPLWYVDFTKYEAMVRERMGDVAGYERCLREVLEVEDSFGALKTPALEAYARLLWQQGKRAEAIRRMEDAKARILDSWESLEKHKYSQYEKVEKPMLGSFRLLRDYYNAVGRTEDAHRQSLQCDTLEMQLMEKRLMDERRRIEMTVYTAELTRQLELRTVEYEREQLRARFSYVLLGLAILGLAVLWVLYRRRQRQLNVLYARQKEVERLETDKRQMAAAARVERLSPEEQLFRELERQFYEEELFRNPGFSRDDLCRLGGSNRMYVSTCINKYAGTNINQWINKARIDYAIRLIGQGEDDLTKLSEQSGFTSLKSFFRSFKQFTELTPRQYIVRERQVHKPDTPEEEN